MGLRHRKETRRRGIRDRGYQGLQLADARRTDVTDDGSIQPAAHQGLGGENRDLRRVRVRDSRVQPQHFGRAEKRARFSVSGMEQQGGRGRRLRWRRRNVRAQVALWMFTDFENYPVFKPGPRQESSVNAMLDQVIAWGGALKTLRQQ